MRPRRLTAAVALLPLVGSLLLLGAAPASAHPLGNFTINHYDGLRLLPDRIEDLAVVDTAEIPTLQERSGVDVDRDGQVSDDERARHAATGCAALAADLRADLAGHALTWTVRSSSFEYRPGAAQLEASRLECGLEADARLDRPGTLTFADGHLSDRLGWREITATGAGVQLIGSPVPAASVSDELRTYPNDLLSSPLDVRSATLRLEPGAGLSTFGSATTLPVAGPVARALNDLSRQFESLVGRDRLTPAVGLLAILLSLVLGASHAAMPGHGKTVIAAYIAGRRGSVRDALTVGATVTVTHTAGVIVLGLLLSAVASLAGDELLGYLGVTSGLLIAAIGGWLLRSALRTTQIHLPGDHAVMDVTDSAPALAVAASGTTVASGTVAVQPITPTPPGAPTTGHGHGHGHGHSRGHGHSHGHGDLHGPLGKGSLIGMGVAGGLVPSPSALVVLLGAISLGRTAFGVLLVLCYGIGMAGTLTLVGLLLVKLRGRLDAGLAARFGRAGTSYARYLPVATATLVLLVGLALAVRGLTPLV